jgi:hypothetical protein
MDERYKESRKVRRSENATARKDRRKQGVNTEKRGCKS